MNGQLWHALRDGRAPHLERYSANINQLIEQMLHPDPKARPTASDIFKHPALVKATQVTLALT
jgi:serine/threonine protein kinase